MFTRSKIFLLLSSFLCLNAYAFKLTPMSSEIKSLGKEAKTTFQVENDGDKKVPVQITLAKRVVDERGKEKYPPAGEAFMVFPTQVILNPGEKRSINVRYMGGGKADHTYEGAYRIIAEQLPLPLEAEKKDDSGAGINVLLRYIAALYVLPDKVTHQIELVEYKLENTTLVLKLKNSGSVHEILENHGVEIKASLKGAKFSKKLSSAKALKGLYGENILANHERYFDISLLPSIDADTLKKLKDVKVTLFATAKEE